MVQTGSAHGPNMTEPQEGEKAGSVELKHNFEIPASVDEAWRVLLDVPRIAPCLPGAELTEVIDGRNFKGAARVRVGPVALRFLGEARIEEIDEASYSARVIAKGADAKGRGNADATIVFALSPITDARTKVDVSTDLNLAGSVAQYGRASGLIDAVATHINSDFTANVESEMTEGAGSAEVADDAATTATPPPQDAAPAPREAPKGSEISGISLLFRALLSVIRGWFGAARR